MKNIEEINRSNLNKIISERKHPDFFPGDIVKVGVRITEGKSCLLYTSPSPRDRQKSRMPSSA